MNDWSTPTLREVPFWRDGMDPEEYEQERDYMIENWNEITKGSKGNYKPLWKQKVEEKA